ncbi:AbrB family transcriptional regulator [Pseudoroseicyclus sp. H15]
MTMLRAIAPHVTALAVALAGAAIAAFIGLPAAPLIGATIGVALVGAAGVPVTLATRLRDIAFATIGVSLGAGVDASIVEQLPHWTVSLVLLVASLAATLAAGHFILTRLFRLNAPTAILGTAPGTMSNALAIAAEGRGDAAAVMVLQVLRVLILVAVVPPIAVAIGAPDVAAAPAHAPMALLPLAVLLALAVALGIAGGRLGVPAAALISGMVLSGLAHVLGLAEGPAPAWAVFIGFAITGGVLGTRVSGISARQFVRYVAAGLVVVLATLVIAMAFAAVTWRLTGLPIGQVVIAFAPGGVEAMAAIGLLLGFDPAYIAAHHFARILILLVLVPMALRLTSRS